MVEILEQIDLHLRVLNQHLSQYFSTQLGVQRYHDGARLAFWQISKFDLLDSNSLASAPVQGAVYATKSTLAEAIAQLLRASVSSRFCTMSHV